MPHVLLAVFCLLYSAALVGPGWYLVRRSRWRPVPALRRPDYAKIARLERELGLADEPVVRVRPAVCLTKHCAGETSEITTWGGHVLRRIHDCKRPAG